MPGKDFQGYTFMILISAAYSRLPVTIRSIELLPTR
jgi:hypothetical protein